MTNVDKTYDTLLCQIKSFWASPLKTESAILRCAVEEAIGKTKEGYDSSNRIYYKRIGFDVLNTNVYCVFLYYLSHILGKMGGVLFRGCR